MSNRRRRRPALVEMLLVDPASLDDLARGLACDDCNSVLAPTGTAHGVTWVEMRHDDTCPWLRRRTA